MFIWTYYVQIYIQKLYYSNHERKDPRFGYPADRISRLPEDFKILSLQLYRILREQQQESDTFRDTEVVPVHR